MGSKRLTPEEVSDYYASDNYTLNSIYINCRTKDQLTCPVGHEIEMRFSGFRSGKRCQECVGNKRYTIDFIKKYSLLDGTICISEATDYKNQRSKINFICPICKNIYSTGFGNFKNQNCRCPICCGNIKKTIEEIKQCALLDGTICTSEEYVNNHEKLSFICSLCNDIYYMRYGDFQQGQRCKACGYKKRSGKNHYNFNPNREEIPLNHRLRNPRKKSWIIKYMKGDPNYNIFLQSPDIYTVDHIIPVSLFCQLHTKYKLKETQVKKIVNQRDNLQLLTFDENRNKWDKGSSILEASNYLINNGIVLGDLECL